MKKSLRIFLCLLLGAGFLSSAYAQTPFKPTLSVQGILKKANGSAVDDGIYPMTFKLYNVPSGGTALWTETQSGVEVSSGIYSVILGKETDLTVSFNEQYYVGVSVGSGEMTPRLELTTFPYAMALLGSSNKFPSAGKVLADSITVKGGVLAGSGAPGANGANKKGYAFSDEKDSGLFSMGNGQASLYADNTEVLRVQKDSLTAYGNLKFESTNGLQYNNLNDWRLVDVDYLEGSSSDGWQVYTDLNPVGLNAWKKSSGSPANVTDFGNFAGKALISSAQNAAFKKEFTPPGPYTYIKVKFRAFILGSWDGDALDEWDFGWAGFANSVGPQSARIGWFYDVGNQTRNEYFSLTAGDFRFSNIQQWGDMWFDTEMTAYYPSSNGPFWVIFTSILDNDGNTSTDENFAVGGIEIWVK
jgi:hypothetical protein